MKTKQIILLSSICLILGGCGEKDPAFDRDWAGNPKKIILNKSGESFSDVAKRILGNPIDSFGLVPEPGAKVDFIEALPLMIRAESQKIYQVSEVCGYKKALPPGQLFGDLDCKDGTAEKLEELAKNKVSGIVELCESVSSDPEQNATMFIDNKKSIAWTTNYQVKEGGRYVKVINSISVFNRPLTAADTQLEPCDLAARATAQNWFTPDVFLGKYVGQCKESRSPGDVVNGLDLLQEPYKISNEKKLGDKVVETTIEYLSRGGSITYFRGQGRCNAFVNREKANQEQAKTSNTDRYK